MTVSKKQKIAGVTVDKWLEVEPTKRKSKIKTKHYDNRAIAFVDILGIKDLINKHTNHDEHKAIDKINQMRKIVDSSSKRFKETVDEYDYLQISDSFVFVVKPEFVIELIIFLAHIQTRIIRETKFLLRGAVTIGNAIVEDDGKFIIGPAYIDAYQLQENDAVYPRIIVDKSVIDALNKKNSANNYLAADTDKEYYINYISLYRETNSISVSVLREDFKRELVYNHLSSEYDKFYLDGKHNICQKFGWTIEYYKKLGVWVNEK